MSCLDFFKWKLEVVNQEYKGDVRLFELECELYSGI